MATYEQELIFDTSKDISLCENSWGNTNSKDLMMILDDVVNTLYKYIDTPLINYKGKLYVIHKPKETNPRTIMNTVPNEIWLPDIPDNQWETYIYQFAHELCHFIIHTDFEKRNKNLYWFEECLCELSSLFCLSKMSYHWQTKPPLPSLSGYSNTLKKYLQIAYRNVEECEEGTSFKIWLKDNINTLSNNSTLRKKNRTVALRLLPHFIEQPQSWGFIQYLALDEQPKIESFYDFISSLENRLPKEHKSSFLSVKSLIETK